MSDVETGASIIAIYLHWVHFKPSITGYPHREQSEVANIFELGAVHRREHYRCANDTRGMSSRIESITLAAFATRHGSERERPQICQVCGGMTYDTRLGHSIAPRGTAGDPECAS